MFAKLADALGQVLSHPLHDGAVRFDLGGRFILVEGTTVHTGEEASPRGGDGAYTLRIDDATDGDLAKLVSSPRMTCLLLYRAGRLHYDEPSRVGLDIADRLAVALGKARARGLL